MYLYTLHQLTLSPNFMSFLAGSCIFMVLLIWLIYETVRIVYIVYDVVHLHVSIISFS
jgi:hypothetical protein